jgi:S-adenosylmethionine-diacylglycerol 3-amino-3-carboxypropyl transferase
LLKTAAQEFFNLIHGNRLIYNVCWEDPRIDRQLLRLGPGSKVVVITSAGCNVLDYLLDSPQEIHAVDVNYRQNALLELKLALFARKDFDDLFAMFGRGGCADYQEIYQSVRELLSPLARNFWDQKINYFSARGLRKSFYWRGAAGDFAWLLRRFLLGNDQRHEAVKSLLNTETLDRQKEYYALLEEKIFTGPVSWLIRQPVCMAMVGVPKAQIRLLDRTHPRGLSGFVQDKLRTVMTELPIRDNYFWRVYLTGSYTPGCCPNYLKEKNFGHIKANISKVKLHTCTLTDFLKLHPGNYTHFILLDHQDWLAWHQPQTLAEEWDTIFQNSGPGAKILLRSAGVNLDFLPDMVKSRLRFFPEQTRPLHHQDRVGTYGSLHLAERQ